MEYLLFALLLLGVLSGLLWLRTRAGRSPNRSMQDFARVIDALKTTDRPAKRRR
ncbi:MAG: hypothetical protein ACRDJ4_10005 [Actinomycetota bacterium]